jgi:hypothetical protein
MIQTMLIDIKHKPQVLVLKLVISDSGDETIHAILITRKWM